MASNLPFNYTGADLYALCSDAMLKAITRQARLVDEKVAAHNAQVGQEDERTGKPKTKTTIAQFFDHYATQEDISVVVTEEDFEGAKRELVPSVSMDELGHYERVRRTFEGTPTPQTNGAGARPTTSSAATVSTSHTSPESRGHSISNSVSTNNTSVTSGSNQSKKPDGVQRMFRRIVSVSNKQRRLSKGKGSSKNLGALAEGHPADSSAVSESSYHDDDADEFVIRTDHLRGSNGSATAPGHKGKGRRGSTASERGFADAAGNDEEELYS